jgi:hypothetical protein
VRRSSALCFETDQNDAAGAAEDGRVIFLNPPGRDLRSRIGPAAYAATVAHLRWFLDDGNHIDALSPFAVSTILTMNLPQLKKDTLAMAPRTSPDADLASAARQLGKPVFAIERPGAALELDPAIAFVPAVHVQKFRLGALIASVDGLWQSLAIVLGMPPLSNVSCVAAMLPTRSQNPLR